MSNAMQEFERKKQELLSYMEQGKIFFQKLELKEQLKQFDSLENKLQNSTFKVLVMGEFKNGKSTFINALLEKKVLPSAMKPCTAIVTEVCFGEVPQAKLFFRDDIDIALLPDWLPDNVQAHIQKNKGGKTPAIFIDYDKLNDYVTIPKEEAGSSEKAAAASSALPYSKAVIEYPLEICGEGVEIIDSPGLNEDARRTQETKGYLNEADAVIFVLNCKKMCSETEMKQLEELSNLYQYRSIFFICNYFDLIELEEYDSLDEKEESISDIISIGEGKLLEYTDIGKRGLHFVSSRLALRGKEKADLDAWENSHFEKMEEELKRFLGEDQGRLKLEQPLGRLYNLFEGKIFQVIEEQLQNLEKDAETIQQKYDALMSDAEELEEEKNLLIENMNAHVERCQESLLNCSQKFVFDISEKIPAWVNNIEPSASLGLLATKGKVDTVVKELVNEVSEVLKAEQQKWQKNTLEPECKQILENFNKSLQEKIQRFKKKLVHTKNTFNDLKDMEFSNETMFFSASLNLEGDGMGDLLKTALLGAVVGVGLALVGLTSPWLLIPAILGAGGITKLLSNSAKMDKIKEEVGKNLAEQFKQKTLSDLRQAPDEFKQRLLAQVETIAEEFQNALVNLKEDAERTLENSRLKGEEKENKRLELEGLQQEQEDFLRDLEIFAEREGLKIQKNMVN